MFIVKTLKAILDNYGMKRQINYKKIKLNMTTRKILSKKQNKTRT